MAKDLGSLFDSVAAITRVAADPKGSLMAGKSAQQIAMEAYAAKAEADKMMEELKNHFIGEFGIAAWDQVLSHTTQIKKEMKAAALADQARIAEEAARAAERAIEQKAARDQRYAARQARRR